MVLRRYPALTPKVVRFNCAKVLKAVGAHPALALLGEERELPKKVSFLTLLLRVLVPYTTHRLVPLVTELCFDTPVLFTHNAHTVSFGTEVRRKVLGEVYAVLEEELGRGRK